jgi:hypothetical protein
MFTRSAAAAVADDEAAEGTSEADSETTTETDVAADDAFVAPEQEAEAVSTPF